MILIRTAPPLPTPVLLLLLLLLPSLLCLLPLAHAQCTRTASNRAAPPDFLCQFNVTFIRQSDCSAHVSESIVFPHTTGRLEQRVIQALPRLQAVSDIRVTRNGEALTSDSSRSSDGSVVVPLSTVRAAAPTTFVLNYTITNAVMRFTDGCGKGPADPLNNIMRWRAGPLDRVVDNVEVIFRTSGDRKLSFIGVDEEEEGTQTIQIRESDMKDEPDFSVVETGGRLCPADQECFVTSMPIWQIVLIGALVGIPVILTGTCIFVFLVCEVCGIRADVEGDDPIDESEMVGFRNTRYSGCIPNHDGFGGCECKKERELFDVQ